MVVAEMGVNWNWSNLDERMERVRDTGCQWVKGQLFYKDQVPERFHEIAMHERTRIERFKDAARQADLIPLFTPMHIDLVRFCDRGHIKIRYSDRKNKALVGLSRQTASRVWISGENVLCVPEYPADLKAYTDALKAVDMKCGSYLEASVYRHPGLGLSSHMPKLHQVMSMLEALPGAQYIEAHIKFSEDDYEAAWSLSCDDFKKLIEWERS